MIRPDPELEPDWDEDNVSHLDVHGIRPNQVEELFYGEGVYPTLAIKNPKSKASTQEYRYRLWGCDSTGTFIEAVVAPYPEYKIWRCVTAFPMSAAKKKLYLRRVKP
jgi:uncharacterized DUF497 family protein